MPTITTRSSTWGPLSEPLHLSVPSGRPPYKDNVFIAFWDLGNDVFASFHASNSPNAEGRRTRFSFGRPTGVVEIIEPLEPGSYTSASLDFDLDRRLVVDSPRISGELEFLPHRALADFANRSTVPSLVPEEPLAHYQRGTRVIGTLVVDGVELTIDGLGFRDRTWGYRDESVGFQEYFGLFAIFDDRSVAAQRHLSADGHDRAEGYVLTESDAAEVTELVDWRRDASGLFAGARAVVPGQDDMVFSMTERLGGFWVPMGWERVGPTLSAYDEFVHVETADGVRGFALVEQGIVRHLY